ncbi:hypothetical protein KP509_12G069500 [Ceratopteris richardii]|uniref:Uncharacterized protein n=1 Tax=Ceratopteris richardii TaxID=49495 RepID=A0A8T2TJY4_CERRI|nr:hypothetical protein KP509_12G069500 [Ceratopteris richardii]KAH7423702.1 hypothetical protein KP509_12G069500 [Ceratopteris richardii]
MTSLDLCTFPAIGSSDSFPSGSSTLRSSHRMPSVCINCSSKGATYTKLVADRQSLGRENHVTRRIECSIYPEKIISEEKRKQPARLSATGQKIQNNERCDTCGAKGVVVCPTCTGSGLYVDSIMESQGIIVKVTCLGCGGSGDVLCFACGGRGHL